MSAFKNISTSLCRHAFPYEWCLHNGTIVCLKMVLTFVKQTASLTDSKHTFLIAFRLCSGFTHGRNNFESMTYSIWALIPLYCPLGKQIMSERGMTGKMLQNRELWSTLSINNRMSQPPFHISSIIRIQWLIYYSTKHRSHFDMPTYGLSNIV